MRSSQTLAKPRSREGVVEPRDRLAIRGATLGNATTVPLRYRNGIRGFGGTQSCDRAERRPTDPRRGPAGNSAVLPLNRSLRRLPGDGRPEELTRIQRRAEPHGGDRGARGPSRPAEFGAQGHRGWHLVQLPAADTYNGNMSTFAWDSSASTGRCLEGGRKIAMGGSRGGLAGPPGDGPGRVDRRQHRLPGQRGLP